MGAIRVIGLFHGFVVIVNAEESSDECKDLAEGNEDGGVDNAEWRNDEACYQKCAAHDDEGNGRD